MPLASGIIKLLLPPDSCIKKNYILQIIHFFLKWKLFISPAPSPCSQLSDPSLSSFPFIFSLPLHGYKSKKLFSPLDCHLSVCGSCPLLHFHHSLLLLPLYVCVQPSENEVFSTKKKIKSVRKFLIQKERLSGETVGWKVTDGQMVEEQRKDGAERKKGMEVMRNGGWWMEQMSGQRTQTTWWKLDGAKRLRGRHWDQ